MRTKLLNTQNLSKPKGNTNNIINYLLEVELQEDSYYNFNFTQFTSENSFIDIAPKIISPSLFVSKSQIVIPLGKCNYVIGNLVLSNSGKCLNFSN